MILKSLMVDAHELEARTGWAIKPEGACKGDVCVPLAGAGPEIDAHFLADRLGMPLVQDEANGLWCLGPEAGGRALRSVQAPDLVLPDFEGREFHLNSLRGTKVALVAWASW